MGLTDQTLGLTYRVLQNRADRRNPCILFQPLLISNCTVDFPGL